MPGAFAHITAVNSAIGMNNFKAHNMNINTMIALSQYSKFCELGSVCPDYPYLTIGRKHTAWSDNMHLKLKTKSLIEAGIDSVKHIEDDERKKKVFAWLCGFVAHVITDVVIHPIVELKVGPYSENQKAHRLCEMHQDTFIYQRLNYGDIGLAEVISEAALECSNKKNKKSMDKHVRKTWEAMLSVLDPRMYKNESPKINVWHRSFRTVVSIAEEGDKLFPLARHVAVDAALTYPSKDKIDKQYIDALEVPGGERLSYDDIFDKAIIKVLDAWRIIGDAVFEDSEEYRDFFGDWNLDTGRDTNGNLVFWNKE